MDDGTQPVNQDEIERLLQQGGSAVPPRVAPSSGQPAGESSSPQHRPPSAGAPPADEESALGSPPSQRPSLAAAGRSGPPAPAEDVDPPLGHEHVERLLSEAGKAAGPSRRARLRSGDVEYLLNQAEQALASIDQGPGSEGPAGLESFRLPELAGSPASAEAASLDLIREVELDLRIELGRTHMYLEDVLRLRRGSVVPLDKLAGDPMDIFVNGQLIARGEVLVLNDNFCVRVAELMAATRSPE